MNNLALPPIIVNATTRTIRSETFEGDDFFGLSPGTNGTAATTRRALAEYASRAPGYRWLRSDGRFASGPNLVPTACSFRSFVTPW